MPFNSNPATVFGQPGTVVHYWTAPANAHQPHGHQTHLAPPHHHLQQPGPSGTMARLAGRAQGTPQGLRHAVSRHAPPRQQPHASGAGFTKRPSNNGAGFDPQSFLAAQGPVMPRVLSELQAGKKTSHWMWFVFPQLKGLGSSDTSRKFGLRASDVADYTWDAALRRNLSDCLDALLSPRNNGRTASQIFGNDAKKLHASLTLFNKSSPVPEIVTQTRAALNQFFQGQPHPETVQMLRSPTTAPHR